MKKTLATLAIAGMLMLTGCVSEADIIREEAETAKVCTDAGGEWDSDRSWGDHCNLDTHRDGAK